MRAQDASQRLHLAMMLRASPIIASAIVTNLNGSKYFDIFILELGCEMRMATADITPRPLDASWNRVTRCGGVCVGVCVFVCACIRVCAYVFARELAPRICACMRQ